MMEPKEIIAMLNKVCTGELTVTATPSARDIYAGDVEFILSNGYKVVVFNDCSSWDYIDAIYNPDGTKLIDFDEIWILDDHDLNNWTPDCHQNSEQEKRMGICTHWGEW